MSTPSIRSIQEAVARHYGVTGDAIRGQSRKGPLVRARQMSIFLARELTDHSYPVIARLTGNRDHSTAIHAVEMVRSRLSDAADLAAIKRELGA